MLICKMKTSQETQITVTTVQRKQGPSNRVAETYIEKDNVSVSISIVTVNTVKSLRELHITHFLPYQRIHHETHCFPYGLAIVDVVITVQIQHVRSICKNSRDTDLQIDKNKDSKTSTIIYYKVTKQTMQGIKYRVFTSAFMAPAFL